MHISRNDGLMEPFFNHKKDTMILTNALINTTKGYTKEEYDLFDMCRNWKEQIKKQRYIIDEISRDIRVPFLVLLSSLSESNIKEGSNI